MIKDVTFFRKNSDCLTFHEHLFDLFLKELNMKNINLATHLEEDIKLTVQITAVKQKSNYDNKRTY